MPKQTIPPVPVQSVDDDRIQPTDILLRLIPIEHYPIDPNTGRRFVASSAFNISRKGVSVLRKGMADGVIQQLFPDFGIAEMTAHEIRKAGCVIAIEEDLGFAHWPRDSHAVVYKQSDTQPKAKLKDRQIHALTYLANKGMRKEPKIP
jgi:hypothetical protein